MNLNIDSTTLLSNRVQFNSKFNYFASYGKKYTHVKKINSIMGPHVGAYESCFNPIYSFHIENFDFLRKYQFIHFRDGVYTLSHFFGYNPSALEHLIPIFRQELFPLIPSEWRKKALFYKYFFLQEKKELSVKSLILYLESDPIINPLPRISAIIDKIKKHPLWDKNSFVKIMVKEPILPFLSNRNVSSYLSDLYKLLRDCFEGRAQFQDFEDLDFASSENSHYLLVNPKLLITSDSYLEHFLMSKGVVPLDIEEAKSNPYYLQKDDRIETHRLFDNLEKILWLSPYHGLKMVDQESSIATTGQNKITDFYKVFSAHKESHCHWDNIFHCEHYYYASKLSDLIL